MQKQNLFFCGIGGNGMSALAQLMSKKGHRVSGSDRNHDYGDLKHFFKSLSECGISLRPQDGSGITQDLDFLIVSTAVENDNPDILRAGELNIPLKHRSELLAEVFHAFNLPIAVAGTSGKSTTTAMVWHILHKQGQSPTLINGAMLARYRCWGVGNLIYEGDQIGVVETDESDGTIKHYHPAFSVINNISLDHKPIDELIPLFQGLADRTKNKVILNKDCRYRDHLKVSPNKAIEFSTHQKTADIFVNVLEHTKNGLRFKVNEEIEGTLPLIGEHNAANAAAALAVVTAMGFPLLASVKSLEDFFGVERRLEKIGEEDGITVIDDFAHNPDKITASLRTLQSLYPRIHVLFQSHGFASARLLKDSYIKTFSEFLCPGDTLLMSEIYYRGGSVRADISARDMIEAIALRGKNARFIESKSKAAETLIDQSEAGDCIAIMGARDPGLRELAFEIVEHLKDKKRKKNKTALSGL